MALDTVLLGQGVGGILSVMALVKVGMKWFRSEQIDGTTVKATLDSYELLNKEVKRLTDLIDVQQRRIDDLENRLDLLRDIELEGASDIAKLEVYIASMPCGACAAPAGTFGHISEIIQSIKDRRLNKQMIIKGEEVP